MLREAMRSTQSELPSAQAASALSSQVIVLLHRLPRPLHLLLKNRGSRNTAFFINSSETALKRQTAYLSSINL